MDKSPDGFHHIRNAEDRYQSLEVVGEHMQAHLGLHVLQPFGQEMRRAHPGLDGSIRMLNRAAPNSHRIRSLFETRLHLLKDVLMFPPGHSSVSARCALFFKRQPLQFEHQYLLIFMPFSIIAKRHLSA